MKIVEPLTSTPVSYRKRAMRFSQHAIRLARNHRSDKPVKKNNKKIERKKLSWRELQNLDSNIVTRNEHSYECHISASMKTFVHMRIVERIALRLYFSRFLLFILC